MKTKINYLGDNEEGLALDWILQEESDELNEPILADGWCPLRNELVATGFNDIELVGCSCEYEDEGEVAKSEQMKNADLS